MRLARQSKYLILCCLFSSAITDAFHVRNPSFAWKRIGAHSSQQPLVRVYGTASDNGDANHDFEMSDQELVDMVQKEQLVELCQQLKLSTRGSKMELLLRLRQHASDQAKRDASRREALKARVEEGCNEDERERHEILGSDDVFETEEDTLDDSEGLFYFELPSVDGPLRETLEKTKTEKEGEKSKRQKPPAYVTQNDVLAPPPPPPDTATLDENGDRVVTVYSTTDHNDLTGVAAAQPGQAALSGTDPMVAGSSVGNQPQPWDIDNASNQKSKGAKSNKELEKAKEKVIELVEMLLAMTGAPAFRHYDMPEGLQDLEQDSYTAAYTASNGGQQQSSPSSFMGFDPAKVPTQILSDTSHALRANRGQVLQEVLREYELHAVGQDGMAGDDSENGGGHFREVAKVRAFLEGFRRAEVRKSARVTLSFLLDKLVSEGIDGLDLTLATMARSNDDSSGVEGAEDGYELNDSLIDYLNDVIREQEKKAERQASKTVNQESFEKDISMDDDPVSRLWNQTKGERGETIESIDPNDPQVQKVLREEFEKAENSDASSHGGIMANTIPDSTPEKLLLLLTLLRERIKTEAAFANDERSRYLRVLAYCLKCPSVGIREELIIKELGSSIDRLDAFIELLTSSIEYAESTSHQLQPARRLPLNVKVLKGIMDQATDIRELQAWKSSGLRP